tara:strand:- start:11243 stop:11458 length:216 start_codon:yes stop_codon:yes gene_type:complete
MNINKLNSAMNYTLNKFCPMILVGFLVFINFGFETWEPYVIVSLFLFAQRFHYNVGYSVAICEERGLFNNE